MRLRHDMRDINLFHHTHIKNLPKILRTGGLGSKNALAERGIVPHSIANDDIQTRRAMTQIPCGPGGTLHDYVPFFFNPRAPMLYTIHRGNVPGYQEGQRSIAHLVTTLEAVRAERACVFTDGHAIMKPSRFFDDLAVIADALDWAVLDAYEWADTQQDPDRQRRR
jgi:hypothetical protein